MNFNGETPLFSACEIGNKDLMKYFLENGADINKKKLYRGNTIIYSL
jgi:ankyrin repeat protein